MNQLQNIIQSLTEKIEQAIKIRPSIKVSILRLINTIDETQKIYIYQTMDAVCASRGWFQLISVWQVFKFQPINGRLANAFGGPFREGKFTYSVK